MMMIVKINQIINKFYYQIGRCQNFLITNSSKKFSPENRVNLFDIKKINNFFKIFFKILKIIQSNYKNYDDSASKLTYSKDFRDSEREFIKSQDYNKSNSIRNSIDRK